MISQGQAALVFLLNFAAFACSANRVYDAGESTPPSTEVEFDTVHVDLTAGEWPADPVVVTNSVLIDQRTQFVGNISVTRASSGPVLSQNSELVVAADAAVTGTVKADTIYLADRAKIDGVANYNQKQGPGSVNGSTSTPLSLPLPAILPTLPTMTAGPSNISLASNEQRTVAAGAYAALNLSQGIGGSKTKLTLSGGVYTFSSLTSGTDTRIECSAGCEIRIIGRASVGARSFLGPSSSPGLGAGNVQLFVKGANGAAGPSGTPAALTLGNDVTLQAYALIPNGTVSAGQRVAQRGKVVTRDFWWGTDGSGRGVQLAIVSQQPTALAVWERQAATFAVTATVPDGTPISYQWQRNGVNLAGKTLPTLTLPSAAMSDNGASFRVLLTTDAGTVTSSSATLTVIRCQLIDNDCNGVDDDCSGVADDDYVPSCSGNNAVTCEEGEIVTTNCDNGNVCDGEESCLQGSCQFGNPASRVQACSDGNSDNGPERCDGQGGCVSAPHAMDDAPVQIHVTAPPTGGNPGGGGSSGIADVTTDAPVTFELPAFIPVSSGNAGQGTLMFSFPDDGGDMVTCSYKGAALTPHPVEHLDMMLGLRYYLQSCSDGTEAGDTVTTNRVVVNLESGDDQFPSGPPSVNLDLGGGCSGNIPPPMQPAEVAFMRQEFAWDELEPLEETNPQGKPALWHGLIYVETKEQLAALDQAKIMWSTQPFTRDYSESLVDKCGLVEHSTDGFGVMVYAIFPAKWWNIMREFGLQASEAGVAPPFSVITPSSPEDPELLESDGSLSYAALAKSGYLVWLEQRNNAQPFWDDVFDYFVYGTSIMLGDVGLFVGMYAGGGATEASEGLIDFTSAGFVASMEFATTLLDDVWETVQEGFQEFALLFTERIEVRVSLSMINTDPSFPPGSPLVRAWGPTPTDAAGNPLTDLLLDSTGALAQEPAFDASGAPIWTEKRDPFGNVELDALGNRILVQATKPIQVPARPRLNLSGAKIRLREFVGPLWTMDEEEIPESGSVTLEHSDAGSQTGVCIQLDADWGMMTEDLVPNEICDHRRQFIRKPPHPQDVSWELRRPELQAFAQIKDGYDYLERVVGEEEPYQMEVLYGRLANTLTDMANTPAMTLCMGFPGAVSTFAGTIQPLGLGGIVVISKDGWFNQSMLPSRGVVTHEYGHFATCNLLFDLEGGDGLLGLTDGLMQEADSRDDENRLMVETIADAFTAQVIGGVNYFEPAGARADDAFSMSYCVDQFCLDSNFSGAIPGSTGHGSSGLADPFEDEIARWQSLVFDAFDRSALATDRNGPNLFNADYWQLLSLPTGVAAVLSYDQTPYVGNADEAVELPGSAWRTWMERWSTKDSGTVGALPRVDTVMKALEETMEQHGVNWCDRCETFALHSPSYPKEGPAFLGGDPSDPVARTGARRFSRWAHCLADDQTRDFVGSPPEAFLNLDNACTACAPLQYFEVSTSACAACPVGEVPRGDHCEACPTGQVPASNNTCAACGARDIVVPDSFGALSCSVCPVGTAPNAIRTTCDPCLADATVDATGSVCATVINVSGSGSLVGDNCPGEFWVDVAAGASPVGVSVDVSEAFSAEQCSGNRVDAVLMEGGTTSTISGHGGAWCDPGCQGDSCLICPPDAPCSSSMPLGSFANRNFRVMVQPTAGYGSVTRLMTVYSADPSCPSSGAQ